MKLLFYFYIIKNYSHLFRSNNIPQDSASLNPTYHSNLTDYPTAQEYSYSMPNNHSLWHDTRYQPIYHSNPPRYPQHPTVQNHSYFTPHSNNLWYHTPQQYQYHIPNYPVQQYYDQQHHIPSFNYHAPLFTRDQWQYYPHTTSLQTPHLDYQPVQNQQSVPSQHTIRLVDLKQYSAHLLIRLIIF